MLTGLRTGKPFILKILKRGNHEATNILYSVIASLQELQRLLLKRPRPLPSDSIEAVILIAHGLRQEPDIGSFIQRPLARHVRPKFARDLEKGILFLGRVRSAYNCFLIYTRQWLFSDTLQSKLLSRSLPESHSHGYLAVSRSQIYCKDSAYRLCLQYSQIFKIVFNASGVSQ